MKTYRDFKVIHGKWVRFAVIVFAIGIVVGAGIASVYPELMETITEGFQTRFGENPALDLNLAEDIFLQNLMVATVAWIGGLFLGTVSVFVVLANGIILGYVIAYVSINSEQVWGSSLLLIVGLTPHAIFELPAFIIAAALGMRLGLQWLSADARGARLAELKRSFIQTFHYFTYVVFSLAIAGLIEVFISGKLVSSF
ncbi:MAG: stage II sporulation protein M [Candidatus Doudnabacteria bacterium]|nr:stage II sporulation protein M [Candidatus Doudnabacteria bacterium]